MLEVLPRFWWAAVWRTGSSWVEQAASEEGELLALYFLDSSWVRRHTGSTAAEPLTALGTEGRETSRGISKKHGRGEMRRSSRQSGADIYSCRAWTGPSEGPEGRPQRGLFWLPRFPQMRWEIPSLYATRCAEMTIKVFHSTFRTTSLARVSPRPKYLV